MLKGYEWRNALVDGLLYSPEYFRGVVDRLENNPDIGMISSLLTYTSRDWYGHKVDEELKRLGLSKRGEKLCRGSMFIMRTAPLKLLKTNLITEDLFRHDEPVSGSSFQNAHLYERLICHLPINLGYRHVASYPKKLTVWRVNVTKLLEPIGKFLFYCEKEGRPKKLVIRVLGLSVYKEK